MSESTNPYDAGVFYTGSFINTQFVQSFTELFADERLGIVASISANPEVSVLIIKHAYLPFTIPDLSTTYIFYYVNASGVLSSTNHIPSFEGKTNHYINTGLTPSSLVLTDDAGGFKYLMKNPTNNTLFATGTQPTTGPGSIDDIQQFFGDHIRFVGEDGQTIYHLTVTTGNAINITPIRVEPQRILPIYVSSGHPKPWDGQNLYLGSITKLGDLSRQLEETETSYGGVSIPSVLTLTLQVADEYLDFAGRQSWDTRSITVQAGLTTDPISLWPVIIRGQTERAELSLDELKITCRDQSILFDRPVQNNTYAGTGGYEGTIDLKGTIKPLVLGHIEHGTPVLVDPILNLYQFNDGPVHSPLLIMYQGGATNFAPVLSTSLLTWNPTPTDVAANICYIDFTRGMFRTAAPSPAPITFSYGYSTSVPTTNTLSDIVTAILQRAVPEVSIDANSFALHKSRQQHEMGIYITDNISVREAFRKLCAPNGNSVIIDNNNRASLRYLRAEIPRAFIEDNSLVDDATLSRREAKRPAATYRQGYQKAYTQLDEGQLLQAGVSEQVRQLLQDEFRWKEAGISNRGGHYFRTAVVTGTSSNIIGLAGTGTVAPGSHPGGVARYASAKSIEFETLNRQGHDDLLVEMAFRDHSLRNLWDITVSGYLYQFNLLDTVLIQFSRFDMSHPQTAIIVAITDMSPTTGTEDQTRLLLLG